MQTDDRSIPRSVTIATKPNACTTPLTFTVLYECLWSHLMPYLPRPPAHPTLYCSCTSQYERVVEPLMLDPSSDAAIAAATVATANDPRMQVNDAMQMPYQIAQRMGYAPLAMMLRPTISLVRLFGDLDRHAPRYD